MTEIDFASVKAETQKKSDYILNQTLTAFGLDKTPTCFDVQRYIFLKNIVQQLSRTKRSVQLCDGLLQVAFCIEDVEATEDKKRQLDCIHFKFIILKDLATSCKLKPSELLEMAPGKICGIITRLVMINDATLNVIRHYCDTEEEQDFFLHKILHKSWYYLICKDNFLTLEKLNETILKLRNKNKEDKPLISLKTIKNNLYIIISKIAASKESQQTKKHFLQQVKSVFGFENEQELIQLYNSKINTQHFESFVLISLTNMTGLGRKYFLEAKLLEREAQKTLQYYSVDNFLEQEFFKGNKSQVMIKKVEKFWIAIEFLSKHVKRDAGVKNSDFIICFLEAFHSFLTNKNQQSPVSHRRQSNLMSYIKTIETILQKQITVDEYLQHALIMQVLYVLRLAIQSEQTVDMAVYCLQILLNQIGVRQAISYFNQIFSMITIAYLKFGERKKIKRYVAKIFEFYIKDKKAVSLVRFKDIQFVLLKELQEAPKIQSVVSLISNELYSNKSEIARYLKEHIYSLCKSNQDIKLLGVKYIQELLESPARDEIRKVLVSPDVLRVVYQGILELEKKSLATASNEDEFSVLCAKCIAQIGLCHTFVNQPIMLRANNQEAFAAQSLSNEETKDQVNQSGAPNVIKSDYHNPLINMKYKQQKHDNTLEILAFPNLERFPIERKNVAVFAEKLKDVVSELTFKTEEKPKNFFYTIFLLNKIILSQQSEKKSVGDRGDQLTKEPIEAAQDEEQKNQNLKFKQEMLMKSIIRFVGIDLDQYKTMPLNSRNPQYFSIFLVGKIDDPQWKQLFEACIPLFRRSYDFLSVLLPYLVYYTLRFSQMGEELIDQIAAFVNDVLDSHENVTIAIILTMFDFFSCALVQDKQIFKEFIEKETRFKYVEKLFWLDLNSSTADQNVTSFAKIINGQEEIKACFTVVKRIMCLLSKIDRAKKNQAAKQISNFKRCVFNIEDNFKTLVNSNTNKDKIFLEFLPNEETFEVFSLHKRLNPEDFENSQFQNFLKSQKNSSTNQQVQCMKQLISPDALVEQKIEQMIRNERVIDDWKQSSWGKLAEWHGDFSFRKAMQLSSKQPLKLFNSEMENKVQQFEIMLAFVFAEYNQGLRALLRCNQMCDEDAGFTKYLESLDSIKMIINYMYLVFIKNLDQKQGEITYYYKLFLHVVYEVETAVIFLKDMVFKEREKIGECLKRDVNKDRRRFEKVYFEFNMTNYFEKLLGWFEERSQDIQSSNESLKLVYYVRRVFFSLFDRENEMAFCTMKIAKLHRKTNSDILVVSSLFKECEKMSSKIVDFELECAKLILQTKNANEAHQFLMNSLEKIEDKIELMNKQIIANPWMPKLVLQKAQLFLIELQIKINHRNPAINPIFQDFVKKIKKEQWEKPNFKFAQYLDMLDSQSNSKDLKDLNSDDRRKRNIQKIFYYIESLKCGFKYIWQSLPRALELWFDYQGDNDDQKMQTYMRNELQSLESFKLATALQIFLSRFGHARPEVRETILIVLTKLAVEYPSQSVWWIFHFHFFDDPASATAAKERKVNTPKQAIERKEFAKELIKKIIARSKEAGDKIMHCEIIFGELKKLSERVAPEKDSTMDIPKSLQNISQTYLVMPIEENLSPQLPKSNFKRIFMTKALVRTVLDIKTYCKENADLQDGLSCSVLDIIEDIQKYLSEFPAFKANPVMISAFTQKVTIMVSKEKPKKIGVIGTDKQVYNFLLKHDKFGDLRKEQRFIDFAGLCNKMLETDPETRKRNLRLRTYAIVPLSRNSGLIEWINNTTTLKCVVSEYWKKQNVKGEIGDIRKKAQEKNKGETHEQIWADLKLDTKPVLANWFADHYLIPDIWYEARLNFIKSTAIWSMIGYVIGLGDRHGDNILIHQHTGEVTHVDFDCIFEKGAKLKIPEIVPFRLTSNIMDGFGIFREKGVYQKSCEVVLRVLRKNQGNINSYLHSFVHDPLIEASQNIKIEIKDALQVVHKKLQGQISGDGNEMSLTIEEQVEQVILNAINDESLSKMYIGWMPWL